MWNTIIVDPMTNALLLIYSIIDNFGLAIIIFTLLVRLLTHPLTVQQIKSSSAMQDLQKSKKFQDLQQKHKGDREKLSQETMKMYQEAGVNPFGSCLPTLIQFPLIIGLYQAIISALASSPLQLINFSKHIYSFFPNVSSLIPLDSNFLWMDLSQPERLPIFGFGFPLLAVLVTITSFLQTRLMTPPSTNPNDQGAMMGRMMGLYMPLFIGWLSYSFPAGLALYFFVSNVFGILQYAAMGRLDWSNVIPKQFLKQSTESKPITKKAAPNQPVRKSKSPKKSKTR